MESESRVGRLERDQGFQSLARRGVFGELVRRVHLTCDSTNPSQWRAQGCNQLIYCKRLYKTVVFAYVQHWDPANNELTLRLLLLPRRNPLDPLTTNAPNFPSAKFVFDVHLQPGLDDFPNPTGSAALVSIPSPVITTALPIFFALNQQFSIDPSPPGAKRPVDAHVKKHLPMTYQQAVGYAPGRTALVFTGCEYSCLFKTPPTLPPYQKLPVPNPKISWGKVIAFVMRNYKFAEAAGLVRSFRVTVPTGALKNGGFIYFTLSSTSDAAGLLNITDGLKVYAARIPALTVKRDLFSPLLFPVAATPPTGDYSDIFAEVDDYDDGWAKAVHCVQPQQLDLLSDTPDGTRPAKEMGIRLGWDDEQVTIWLNRQLAADQAAFDSPLGVFGYRIDVHKSDDASKTWHSLVRATGPIGVLGGPQLDPFDGELGAEIHPTKLEALQPGDYWLPTYFTAWSGPSLVTLDVDRIKLAGGPDPPGPPGVKGLVPDILLQYGTDYDFRVRLMDHTGGGPQVDGEPINPGPKPISTIRFVRWIRPLVPQVVSPRPDPNNPPASLTFKRPLLHYPAAVCTGFPNALKLLYDDLPNAVSEGREPGIPDPDVVWLQVTIEVGSLPQDPAATDGSYIPVATVKIAFPDDPKQPVVIPLNWIDIADATTLDTITPPTGKLLLPTARDVRLRVAALCKDNPSPPYFGARDVMLGPSCQITLRKDSSVETKIFAMDTISHRFSAYFFQPDPSIDATILAAQRAAGRASERPSDIATRAATAFGLRNDGYTLRSMPNRRVVFGCTPALRHTIGPDGASISFSSQADLALHWVVMIWLVLDRDWSWDGFARNGITVRRDGVVVGTFSPTRSVNSDALGEPLRSQSDLIFFDAIDPKPATGSFPAELHPVYTVTCAFLGTPTADPPLPLTMRLPITTPPAQLPQLTSAGIAMSPYTRSADYSSTSARARILWIELASPPINGADRYFARVLRNAPDPLLSSLGDAVPDILEPPLAIDPEPVRKIVEGQADDRAGISAMQPLIPSDSPLCWGLPLPPGLDASAPELFGFFTYEIRVGHFVGWSTAQGRFGPPLRVAGVQHPPPQLECKVFRDSTRIIVTAPYALPVLDGVRRTLFRPRSAIWAMLYVQAAQIDGADHRNVLIGSTVARFDEKNRSAPSAMFGEAGFRVTEVSPALVALGFAATAPLSVLAVELLPQDVQPTAPLGENLGGQRILRTSLLTPVPDHCC